MPVSPEIERARLFLGTDAPSPDDALALSKELKRAGQFSYARRVLEHAAAASDGAPVELWRQLAHATSNDLDQPSTRHAKALALLEQHADLAETTAQETLGVAGGILKRWWDFDGNVRHLERALAYYRRGYEQGIARDNGYTAINTAFLLDLLASIDARDDIGPEEDARRAEAVAIRRKIIDELAGRADGDWWTNVTLAEAQFGVDDYPAAGATLAKAAEGEYDPWQYESTVRQLATLARVRAPSDGFEASAAAQVVFDFLGPAAAEGVLSARVGKVGLALSGGGFRASFFHIGVLAKLAELDVLRRVEVLSCVSGGSIVGAHYYLKVRELLQRKRDDEIEQRDYVRLVQELADEFLAGVQTNIRCRAGLSPITHLRTIFQPDYTTRKVGELLERELYARVGDGEGAEPRWLTKLLVRPAGGAENFDPKRHNWLRRAKVPVLVLNATTLNTGHNWQFTATWMGEPPAGTENPADRNAILRRLWYEDAPAPHDQVRLGTAVAASACVPGLFNPMVFRDLYGTVDGEPKRITVRLVDGGIHDNQGIASLVEQACDVMVVSDASGQMGTVDDPGASLPSVPVRTSSILMARVRGAQYDDLVARLNASVLRGLLFLHLKLGLPLRVVDWNRSNDPLETKEHEPPGYGVATEIQERLANIRTDLDAFHDAEAFALMTSAYRMTGDQLPKVLRDVPTTPVAVDWSFLAIDPLMDEPTSSLVDVLGASEQRFFKTLRMSRGARIAAAAAGAAVALAVLYAFWAWRGQTLLTVGIVGGVVLAYSVLSFVSKKLGQLKFRETVARAGIELCLAVFAPIAFGIHLLIGNRMYLARGRVVRDAAGRVTIGAPGRLARAWRALSRRSDAPARAGR